MVLYVASAFSALSDSPGRKISKICETWAELGFPVHLVCGGDLYPDRTASEARLLRRSARGIRVRVKAGRLSWLAPLVHSASEFRDMLHDRRLRAALIEMTTRTKPTLVWHRVCRLHLAPLLVARELGVPYVAEWIDSQVPYRFSLFRRRALAVDRDRMRQAHRVLVVSHRLARDLAASEGIPLERFVVAHNAVDVEEFTRDPAAGARVREGLGVPPDAFVAGYVGSYAWYHETSLLPVAAKILRDQLGKPVIWILVGDGHGRAEVDALSQELGVAGLVHPVGRVPSNEVAAWLSAMDAAVLPGCVDTICPIKVQEYMAAATAPVVPDTEANREVVEHGRTGLLFQRGDANSLAEQLKTLASNPDYARRLGDAARQEAVTRFSWENTWGRALEQVMTTLEAPTDA